jgi:hypothetical protein
MLDETVTEYSAPSARIFADVGEVVRYRRFNKPGNDVVATVDGYGCDKPE